MMCPNRKKRWSMALFGAALAVTSFAAPPALADGSLVVRDFVLTNGIVEREPSDAIYSSVVRGHKVFAFARIRNSGDSTAVNFVWQRDGNQHGSVWLNVGVSSGWRTWSSAILSPGEWRVQLVDTAGEVLSERTFTVDSNPTMAETMMQYQDTSAELDVPESMFQPMR